MALVKARVAFPHGTLAELNATNVILEKGEWWFRTDAPPIDDVTSPLHGKPDPALQWKYGDGTKKYSELDFVPIGTGASTSGAGLTPISGTGFLGKANDDVDVPSLIDPEAALAVLNAARYSSEDPEALTLLKVIEDFNTHISKDGTDADVPTALAETAHGLVLAWVLQASPIDASYTLATTTTEPSGNAPSGKVKLIGYKPASGNARGLYYQDEFGTKKLDPDAFTPFARIPLLASTDATITWTDMPSALTELFGNTRNRSPVTVWEDDGTTKRYTQARIGVQRVFSGAAAGAKLALYYDNAGTLAAAGTAAIEVAIGTAGSKLSSWVDLAAGVFTRETSAGLTVLAVQGSGGDGAADAPINGVFVDLR